MNHHHDPAAPPPTDNTRRHSATTNGDASESVHTPDRAGVAREMVRRWQQLAGKWRWKEAPCRRRSRARVQVRVAREPNEKMAAQCHLRQRLRATTLMRVEQGRRRSCEGPDSDLQRHRCTRDRRDSPPSQSDRASHQQLLRRRWRLVVVRRVACVRGVRGGSWFGLRVAERQPAQPAAELASPSASELAIANANRRRRSPSPRQEDGYPSAPSQWSTAREWLARCLRGRASGCGACIDRSAARRTDQKQAHLMR